MPTSTPTTTGRSTRRRGLRSSTAWRSTTVAPATSRTRCRRSASRTTASRSRPAAPRASPMGRTPTRTADWVRNDFDLAGIPTFAGTPVVGEAYNTPGAANEVVSAEPLLSINDVTSAEGASGATTFEFTVSLTNAADGRRHVRHRDRRRIGDGAGRLHGEVPDRPDDPGRQHDATRSTSSSTATRPQKPDETFFVNVTNVVGRSRHRTPRARARSPTTTRPSPSSTTSRAAARRLPPGTFTIEGIVVGDYQTQGTGQLRGFFVQEEDADADADPATSEGIFVFCSTCPDRGRRGRPGARRRGRRASSSR